MEEDLDFKHEILPWCMGPSWRSKFVEFQREKQQIWRRMNFRLMVSVEELESILNQGNHWIWSRERNEYHAGARRHRSAYPWSDCSDDSSPNRSKNLLMSDSDSDS